MRLRVRASIPTSSAISPEGVNLDVIGYDLVQTGRTKSGAVSNPSFVQTGAHVMLGLFYFQGSGHARNM